jgi:hypothetical protein
MTEAVRKDKRWKSVVSNARAIRGALGECLKLSDQLTDVELKLEAMRFVNAIEHHTAVLLGEERRVSPRRPPEKELLARLREEVSHIRQLMNDNERIAFELGENDAKKLVAAAVTRLSGFAAVIDRKA